MFYHQRPFRFVKDVVLRVTDLDTSLQFYKKYLGLSVLEREADRVKLTADGEYALLSLEELGTPARKERERTGLYHLALLVPSRAALAEVLDHLADKNIPVGSADHLVSESLYISDPDGNGLEIYADRSPSEWEWHNGGVIMGVAPLDFEDLRNSGESAENFRKLPEETVIGHIHLHVSDLQEAENFYTDGLGFATVSRLGDRALFLADGGYHHHIGLNTWAGTGIPAASRETPGLESFTIVLPDKGTVDQTVRRLKEFGAPVTEREGAVVTEDPSGNRIRLVV
ncbi:VOC family protein [Salimicrobium salexigens]|uniref:Catechol 2,3-dioxygenase n=1 Tax=Salimicrobium salexigens TaxID=908941 RepID=A0ABY1KXY8_9BACI|nr:VOC family protein [Salimicrobium salexigens]SIS90406.1 catechol 2,3-dioxygenase [Salimicrobium salexigens]